MEPDLLDDVLAELRADAVVTGHFTLSAPWGILKPAVEGASFRMCAGAPFYLTVLGSAPIHVTPGDFILLPHGDEHVIRSSLDVSPEPFDTLMSALGIVPKLDTPLEFAAGGGGAETVLYTGIVTYADAMPSQLLDSLPVAVHVRADDPVVMPWLASAMKSFIRESMKGAPCWRIAAARLADVLLVHVLRAHLAASSNHVGWVRGLLDPQIGTAMAALRNDPARAWNVGTLAAQSGMSRSRFGARFVELVGESPVEHLTAYRMTLACELLANDRARVIEVAEKVGYASEKAFSRAFSRWAGMPPKRYAREVIAKARERTE